MNQRERVLAAIKGQPVDHVPSLFSLHFPKEVSAGEAAVEAHISFYKETGVDVIKIMNENLEPALERSVPFGTGTRCSPTAWTPPS